MFTSFVYKRRFASNNGFKGTENTILTAYRKRGIVSPRRPYFRHELRTMTHCVNYQSKHCYSQALGDNSSYSAEALFHGSLCNHSLTPKRRIEGYTTNYWVNVHDCWPSWLRLMNRGVPVLRKVSHLAESFSSS